MTGTMTGVTAFVLAGGRSVRMGRDKALLAWEGRTLLEHALEVAGAVAGSVQIVGAKDKFAPYGKVVEDVYPERGPLGGIHAGLVTDSSELNLFLAVDLPYVTPALLAFLIRRAQDGSTLVTAPRLAAGWEPLCAVYRAEFAAIAERALREGRNAIHPLLDFVGTLGIDEGELAAAGFPATMFRNLNTAADLEVSSGADALDLSQ